MRRKGILCCLSSEACPGLGVGMQASALALGQRRLARPCLAPCPGVPGLWVMEGGSADGEGGAGPGDP